MSREIKDFFSNYTVSLFSNVGSLFLGLITFSILLQLLSKQDYGAIALFNAAAALVILPFGWVTSSLLRFGKESFVKDGKINVAFWSQYVITIPTLCLIILGVLIYKDWIISYVGMGAIVIPILLILICVSFFAQFSRTLLQVVGQMKYFALIPIITMLVNIVIASLMLLGVLPQIAATYLIGGIISSAIIIFMALALIHRQVYFPLAFEWQTLKEMLNFGYPLVFGGASVYIINTIDVTLLKQFTQDNEVVATYAAAYRLNEFVYTIPSATINLMLPIMIALIVQRRDGAVRRYLERLVPQIMWAWAILLVIGSQLSTPAIKLIGGPAYGNANYPLVILLLGSYFRGFLSLYSPILTSYKIIKPIVGLSVMQAVLNLGFDYFLIPFLGLIGPAISTTVVWMLAAFGEMWLIERNLKLKHYYLAILAAPILIGTSAAFLPLSGVAQLLLFVGLLLLAFFIAKKYTLFSEGDLIFYEQVKMPAIYRTAVYRFVRLMS